MKTKQTKLIKFLVKYPNEWHTYAKDKETVGVICACYNLGVLKLNQYGQMRLKSLIRARQFLNA